jgi:hypothetical protein
VLVSDSFVGAARVQLLPRPGGMDYLSSATAVAATVGSDGTVAVYVVNQGSTPNGQLVRLTVPRNTVTCAVRA